MEKEKQIIHIAEAAIRSVNPYGMIQAKINLEGKILTVDTGPSGPLRIDLSSFENIYVIGAGKATAPMALAMEEILGDLITEGTIAVKPGHTASLSRIRQIEGGHPVPSEGSVNAARKIIDLADSAGKSDLVINLISGGGSSLLTLPYNGTGCVLDLQDMQETTKALLACGAPIQEMNCIRKHLSSVKGGRLAEHIYPAESISLILSDVVGDDLQSIASGLTVPDTTTYADALGIVSKYGIQEKLPGSVVELLTAGEEGAIPDTPKPGAECFSRCRNILLGTNSLALQAAATEAKRLGYHPVILSSMITGEAKEIAKFFSAIAREASLAGDSPQNPLYPKPCCILAGGETTVTVRGSGKGGRNQEMALSFLSEIAENPKTFPGVLFASVATDGNDGPTDAAGAFASAELARKAADLELSISRYLAGNDAYSFFSRAEGLIKTGPTNTNVCDIQIILID